MRTLLFIGLVVALATLSTMPALGHEIGTSRVSVVFNHDQTYQIEIVTDAGALIDKLAAVTGGQPPAELTPAALQPLLTRLDETFRRRVNIKFDGVEVHPAIAYSVAPGAGAGASAIAIIRLAGRIPSGAQRFGWTYSWTYA